MNITCIQNKVNDYQSFPHKVCQDTTVSEFEGELCELKFITEFSFVFKLESLERNKIMKKYNSSKG